MDCHIPGTYYYGRCCADGFCRFSFETGDQLCPEDILCRRDADCGENECCQDEMAVGHVCEPVEKQDSDWSCK